MPAQANDTDELFEVKTHFFIGNYQTAINEANKLKVSQRCPDPADGGYAINRSI